VPRALEASPLSLRAALPISSRAGGGASGESGELAAARRILESAGGRARAIAAVKIGTTIATNALLTRSGEPVALVTTAGFADARSEEHRLNSSHEWISSAVL